jgi:hypothetical protein
MRTTRPIPSMPVFAATVGAGRSAMGPKHGKNRM